MNRYLIVLSFLLFSSSALAVDFDITLSKNYTSGHYLSPNYVSIQCNIIINNNVFGIEVKRTLGTVTTQEFANLRITNSAEINQRITEAKQGPIDTRSEAPSEFSLSYVAIRKTPAVTEYVDLSAMGGGLYTVNSSPAASWLIHLLDLNCPKL